MLRYRDAHTGRVLYVLYVYRTRTIKQDKQMKIVTTNPNPRTYPYLAIWAGEDQGIPANELISPGEILVVSKLKNDKVYVHRLIGGDEGYITQAEAEYTPLPRGFTVEITQ